jgi:hypothetical protein
MRELMTSAGCDCQRSKLPPKEADLDIPTWGADDLCRLWLPEVQNCPQRGQFEILDLRSWWPQVFRSGGGLRSETPLRGFLFDRVPTALRAADLIRQGWARSQKPPSRGFLDLAHRPMRLWLPEVQNCPRRGQFWTYRPEELMTFCRLWLPEVQNCPRRGNFGHTGPAEPDDLRSVFRSVWARSKNPLKGGFWIWPTALRSDLVLPLLVGMSKIAPFGGNFGPLAVTACRKSSARSGRYVQNCPLRGQFWTSGSHSLHEVCGPDPKTPLRGVFGSGPQPWDLMTSGWLWLPEVQNCPRRGQFWTSDRP